jgi:hypothetical protein
MATKISDIKSKLTGGGARPNLFEVELAFPSAASPSPITIASNKTDVISASRILVKSAGLPASNVNPIEVPFRGRIFKLAGERTFDTWTVTVLNDNDFLIRGAMEEWMAQIAHLSDFDGKSDPQDYQADGVIVKQLDRSEKVVRQYKFYGMFPTNISQIDVSFDTQDTIEEFTVEFQVQYYEVLDSSGANIVN